VRRLSIVCCALGLAVAIGGCGDSVVRSSSAPSSFDDATLAGDLLETQLAALHHALPGGWERVASSPVSLQACAGWAIGRSGTTADRASPPFAYRHRLGLRVVSLIYSDAASAGRAQAALAVPQMRSCLAAQLLAGLRERRYRLGRARSSLSQLHGVGSQALALTIAVPAAAGTRSYNWRYEVIAVRQGRRIDLLASTSTVTEARTERQLAAALARVTAVAARYLETGQVATTTSTGG
jgi:hypothetical protein